MGQVASGSSIYNGFLISSDKYSIIFGFVSSCFLVLVNTKYTNNLIYFVSTFLLLYVNFTMSLIIEHTDLFLFLRSYLNIKIFIVALSGTFIVHAINESIKKNKVMFLSEVKPEETRKIYQYSLIVFIVFQTNVTMEMIHVGSVYIDHIFDLSVMLLAAVGIFISLLLQLLFFRIKSWSINKP